MPAIGEREFRAAYLAAKSVYRQQITEHQAATQLSETVGMSVGSAYDYVRVLGLMLNGRRYTRTINDPATRYYLQQIAADFGPQGLTSALAAVRNHIAYYEQTASKRPSLRLILEEFESASGHQDVSAEIQFEAEVQASLRLSDSDRRKLLPPKGTKPTIKSRTFETFVRNPHVVAAALVRANGFCERCEKPAPFKRKTDGTPFLEVHHRTRLAENGDDTLENAEALCPNCHREAHYG